MKCLLTQLIFILCMIGQPGQSQTLRYVTSAGAGLKNGSSWANAYDQGHFQTAIDVAIYGDEVWVAEGFYGSPFKLKDGVSIYGGFKGDETWLWERDLTSHTSDITRLIIEENDNISLATVLDGFRICCTTDSPILNGSGIHVDHGSPVIRNCIFNTNDSPGTCQGLSIWLNGSNARIENCRISGNWGEHASGGGICITGASKAVIRNCIIQNNYVAFGGGIYILGADAEIINTVITGNASISDLGGGGIYISNDENYTVILRNCAITGNTANSSSWGGGINANGSRLFMYNCIVWNNANMAGLHTPDASVSGATQVVYKNSLVHNISATDANNNLDGITNSNDLNFPRFIQLVNTDQSPFASGNTRLNDNSPCIDKGNNTLNNSETDLDKNQRISNPTIDLGAFEYQSGPIVNLTARTASNLSITSFRANWHGGAFISSYFLDVATDENFTNYVNGYNNLDVGNAFSHQISGLEPATTYYYRVRCTGPELISGNSNTVKITTLKEGVALDLDGINDYVVVQYEQITGNAPRTIEMWIKTTEQANTTIYASGDYYSLGGAFNITLENGKLGLFQGIESDNFSAQGVPINDGLWHHIAVTFDGHTITAFVDGKQQWSNAIVQNTENERTIIGGPASEGVNDCMAMQIDEFRIWKKALTACEIIERKDCEIKDNQENLVVYYNFNQGAGNGDNQSIATLIDVFDKSTANLYRFSLNGTTSNFIDKTAVATGVNCSSHIPYRTIYPELPYQSVTFSPSNKDGYWLSSGMGDFSPMKSVDSVDHNIKINPGWANTFAGDVVYHFANPDLLKSPNLIFLYTYATSEGCNVTDTTIVVLQRPEFYIDDLSIVSIPGIYTIKSVDINVHHYSVENLPEDMEFGDSTILIHSLEPGEHFFTVKAYNEANELLRQKEFHISMPNMDIYGLPRRPNNRTSYDVEVVSNSGVLDKITWYLSENRVIYDENKIKVAFLKSGVDTLSVQVRFKGNFIKKFYMADVIDIPLLDVRPDQNETFYFKGNEYRYSIYTNFLNSFGFDPDSIVFIVKKPSETYSREVFYGSNAILKTKFDTTGEHTITVSAYFKDLLMQKAQYAMVYDKLKIQCDTLIVPEGESSVFKIGKPVHVLNCPSGIKYNLSTYAKLNPDADTPDNLSTFENCVYIENDSLKGTGAFNDLYDYFIRVQTDSGTFVTSSQIHYKKIPEVDFSIPSEIYQNELVPFCTFGNDDDENGTYEWLISGENNSILRTNRLLSEEFEMEGSHTVRLKYTSPKGFSKIIEKQFDVLPGRNFILTEYAYFDGFVPGYYPVDFDTTKIGGGATEQNFQFTIAAKSSNTRFKSHTSTFKNQPSCITVLNDVLTDNLITKTFTVKGDESGKYAFDEEIAITLDNNETISYTIPHLVNIVGSPISRQYVVKDTSGIGMSDVDLIIYETKSVFENNGWVQKVVLFKNMKTDTEGRAYFMEGDVPVYDLNVEAPKRYIITLKPLYKNESTRVITTSKTGTSTIELIYRNDEVQLADMSFQSDQIIYNETLDEYSIYAPVINNVVQISDWVYISNSKKIPTLKTNGKITLKNLSLDVCDAGEKMYTLGLSMFVPKNGASYFNIEQMLKVDAIGAVMSFSGDTVDFPSFLELPWLLGDLMKMQKEKFRNRSEDLITDPQFVERAEELHKLSKSANEAMKNIAKYQVELPNPVSKALNSSAKILKLYDCMFYDYGLAFIRTNRVYIKDRGYWDFTIDIPAFDIKGFKLEKLYFKYEELHETIEATFKLSWGDYGLDYDKDGISDARGDSLLSAETTDSLLLLLNEFRAQMAADAALRNASVDFTVPTGERIYNSSYDESFDITNTISTTNDQRRMGLTGLGVDFKMIEGKLNKIIISAGVDIPLPPLPMKISEVKGGVSDLTYIDEAGHVRYKSNDFLIEMTCEMIDKAETGIFKVEDMGYKIRPFNYFEGGGKISMLDFKVGEGRVFLDLDEQLFKAEIWKAGFPPFGKEGYVSLALGGKDKLTFEGYAAMNFGVPDYPMIFPACLRKITVGGAEAGINQHRIAAKLKIGSTVVIPQIESRGWGGRLWKGIKKAGTAFVKTCTKIGNAIVEGAMEVISYLNIEIGIGYDFDKKEFLWGSNVVVPTRTMRILRDSIEISTFQVSEDTRKVYFFVDNNGADSVEFNLYCPEPNRMLFNNHPQAQKVFFAESKTSMIVVEAPARGQWEVQIDLEKYPGAKIQVIYANNTPGGYFISPAKEVTNKCTVEMKFNDISDTVDVKLFITDTREGYTGREITSFKVMNHARLKFDYSGEGLEPGMYYFYFVIKDGSDLPVMQFAPGSLLVTGNKLMPKPQNVKSNMVNDTLYVYWKKTNPAYVTYTAIYLNDLANGKEMHVTMIPEDSIAVFNKLIPGHRYVVKAVNYNTLFGYSEVITLPEFVFNRPLGNKSPVWAGAPYNQFRFREYKLNKYGLNIVDPEGSPVTLEFVENLPKTMILKGDSVIWYPNPGDKGIYSFHAIASDGINKDTILLSMLVDPFSMEEVNITFPSANLYEADMIFVQIEDLNAIQDSIQFTLMNWNTKDSASLYAQHVGDGKYISSFDLSFKRRSEIAVNNGDTIVAFYMKDGIEYATFAFFNINPQVIDNIPPDNITDLRISPIEGTEKVRLIFTVPYDRLVTNSILANPWEYELRYNYSNLLNESDYTASNKIEYFNVKKAGEIDTLIVDLRDLYDNTRNNKIWFNLKAGDAQPKFSGMSNTVDYKYITGPTNVKAIIDSAYTVSLTWNGPSVNPIDSTLIQYNIYRQVNRYAYELVGKSDTSVFCDSLNIFLGTGTINYAVEAVYAKPPLVTNASYSNELEVDMMSGVVVHITCDSTYIKGFDVSLIPWVDKFDIHHAETDSSGYAIMLYVHNSIYTLNISRNDTSLLTDTVTVSQQNHTFNYSIGWPVVITRLEDDNLSEQDGIEIYPNPSTGKISVSLGKYAGMVHEFWLLTAKGTVMMTNTVKRNEATLDLKLDSLPPGIYFLVLKTNMGLFNKKVILLK